MISDLFHWMLTGVPANELTIASTTQLYDPRTQAWSDDLIARLELPRQLFGPLIAPGTSLGPLLPEIVAETGLKDVQVVVPGSHDTASAVLAVPAAGKSWCYISSGTWSLMGIETAAPVINGERLPLELHQRSRRRRHDAAAEEHQRAVAHPGVPARMARRGARLRLATPRHAWPRKLSRSVL